MAAEIHPNMGTLPVNHRALFSMIEAALVRLFVYPAWAVLPPSITSDAPVM